MATTKGNVSKKQKKDVLKKMKNVPIKTQKKSQAAGSVSTPFGNMETPFNTPKPNQAESKIPLQPEQKPAYKAQHNNIEFVRDSKGELAYAIVNGKKLTAQEYEQYQQMQKSGASDAGLGGNFSPNMQGAIDSLNAETVARQQGSEAAKAEAIKQWQIDTGKREADMTPEELASIEQWVRSNPSDQELQAFIDKEYPKSGFSIEDLKAAAADAAATTSATLPAAVGLGLAGGPAAEVTVPMAVAADVATVFPAKFIANLYEKYKATANLNTSQADRMRVTTEKGYREIINGVNSGDINEADARVLWAHRKLDLASGAIVLKETIDSDVTKYIGDPFAKLQEIKVLQEHQIYYDNMLIQAIANPDPTRFLEVDVKMGDEEK